MKKLLLLILSFLSLTASAQIATGVNNLQAFPWKLIPNDNIIGVIFDGSQYRMYGFDKYALLDTTSSGKFATKFDVSKKLTIPTGTVGQYLNGAGIPVNLPIIPAQFSPAAGAGINIAGTYPNQTFTNSAPDQTVTLTPGNRISITGTYPNFTISYIEPTPVIVTRAVNTNYTVSSTKQATVFYSVTATTTNPLLVGTYAGTAFLEYSINGGTTWINPTQAASTSAVGLTVTVALTTGNTSVVAGIIPANSLVRIRTTTAGTATVVYAVGQETY